VSFPQASVSSFVARERILCVRFQQPKLNSSEKASVLENLSSEVTCGRITFEMQYFCQLQPEEETKKTPPLSTVTVTVA